MLGGCDEPLVADAPDLRGVWQGHNLYPGDKGVVVVTRYLDGDEMIWRWGPYKNRLRRLTAPDA